MTDEKTLLELRNLEIEVDTPRGPIRPVSGISLSIPKGKTLALVGEAGCGKSMTALSVMRLLPGNARILSGTDTLSGEDLFPVPESVMQAVRGRRIGMIFQEPSTSLNPVMTVGDQIGEVLSRHLGLKGKEKTEEEIAWLRRVGIPEPEKRVNAFPFQLSGGQKQRCMIAMALAGDPDLVIADEPTTALDVTLQKQILDLLLRLQAERSLSLLLITHDLAVVRKMAHYVALMYAGEIVEQAPADEFFSHPAHPYAKQLLAALPSTARKGKLLASIPGTVPDFLQPIEGCRFAPRCLWAVDACREGTIPLKPISDVHACACIRPYSEKTRTDDEPPLPPKAAPGRTLLEAKGLRVWFPEGRKLFRTDKDYVHAVDGIDITLRENETLALVGESGSGKTTAGKAILRLLGKEAKISGSIRICGEDTASPKGKNLKALRQAAQIIFQDPFSSLDPRMTVGETLLEALESLRPDMSREEKSERIRGLLSRVGLREDALRRYPHEFSGGQRQRIAIARALAPEPKLIICDEPTSALDVSVQAQILNLLGRIQRETGIAYLLITHNFGVVEYIADRVAVMRSGKIVEEGPLEDVLQHPASTYTRELLDAVPRLGGI